METLNNFIGFSFFSFVVILGILGGRFWGETKKFEKTNKDPNVRQLWILSILGGLSFFIFIVSLMIKLINIIFN